MVCVCDVGIFMRKYVKKIITLTCAFVLCSLVIAGDKHSTEDGKKLGIFFCTCDLGASESKVQHSDKNLAGYPDSFIVIDREDSSRYSPLRHCFVMAGYELGGTYNKLVIEVIFSLGYYNIGANIGMVQREDDWLLNAGVRKKYVISCTPVIQEGMVGINKANPKAGVTRKDVNDIWYKLRDEMTAADSIYDRDTNNCCTVAFEALRKVRDENKDFSIDLSHIKKRNFNIFGRGISFDPKDDFVSDYIEGSSKLIGDGVSVVPKIVVRKIDSSEYVEIEHDLDKQKL
jgi:hypothetical protein